MISAEENSSKEDTVYHYQIPLETVDGVTQPIYKPSVNGEQYLYHYGTMHLHIIQENGAGHLHTSNVDAIVNEISKKDVVESDNLLDDFVR